MKIIGLAGAAGTGKTTLAHSFSTVYQDEFPISVKSFATPLKTMVRSLAFSLGHVRPLDEAMAPFAATPLRETARVAALVRARLPV